MIIALSILGYIAVVTLIAGFFKVANNNSKLLEEKFY